MYASCDPLPSCAWCTPVRGAWGKRDSGPSRGLWKAGGQPAPPVMLVWQAIEGRRLASAVAPVKQDAA